MSTRSLKISLLSLLCCSSYFSAANADSSEPVLVSVPSFSTKYEINASLLWQQITSTSNDYSVLITTLPATSLNWLINTVNPQLHLGFDVGVGYKIADTGNDVQLNWTRMKTRDSESVTANRSAAIAQILGPFYQMNPVAPFITASAAQNFYIYDLVNLDAGQFVSIGDRLQTRFFGGVNYLRVKQNLQTSFFVPTDVHYSFVSNNISEFTGFGPRFGIAGIYDLCHGFGVTAEIAGTVSIGRIKATDFFTATSTALGPTLNKQSIATQHETRIVPGGDAKLGINYAYAFCNNSQVTGELGYQVTSYSDVIKTVAPQALGGALQTGSIFAATMEENQSNFGVHGPYLNLSYSY